MSRGMQTSLTSGAYHGRTRRLYVWGLPRGKRTRRNGLALCGLQSPAASAQARPAVGGALRGHDAPLAAGRQKYRWPPWLGVGCHVVCRLVKKLMRPRTRSISGARRVVLDSASGLDVFHLPLTEDRAGHSPCPDDSARDDSVPYTRGAHARATLPQTRSA